MWMRFKKSVGHGLKQKLSKFNGTYINIKQENEAS